ncbi:MAG: AIPR family protein, partial [Bacteroidaceae bacterium]|nr:AIPR family protein [Bacteroidaceae bacterium]
MDERIKTAVAQIKERVKSSTACDIADDRAFSHLILEIFYKQKNIADHCVTDGKNDGGIDFVFFNDEENKLILGQSKYTETLQLNDIVAEYNKMYTTYCNFKKGNTTSYNADIRKELQNGIDRLPDDNSGSVEYCLFTTANNIGNDIELENKVPDTFPIESAKIFNQDDIINEIELSQSEILTVKYDKIKLYKDNENRKPNFLKYESDDLEGIMCNVASTSLVRLCSLYANGGLFDLNIRRYIHNKSVDEGIKHTLNHNRMNFWFLNNGIIIACEEFHVDGDNVKLSNFSIVNGGQTTHLISSYKPKGTKSEEQNGDFAIPCKIVAVKEKNKASKFFNKIAEATNSQKPILQRDLRSNSKEMVSLQRWLNTENIYLEIKRGTKKPKSGKFKYIIKNDELGQLILSFVYQQPGTSRSGKKSIFENNDIYGKLFRVNYTKSPEKKSFILDIVSLNERYKELENTYKDTSSPLTKGQTEILKNGKQTIFALMGLCYMLANEDITKEQVLSVADQRKHFINSIEFEYGPILSNYKSDDIDKKFRAIVYAIISVLDEQYRKASENNTVSSVSNFMKTDV